MSELRKLKSQILQEGIDGRIDDADLALLREHLPPGGAIDAEDMQVLIELRSAARSVCPAFDAFFFPAFKRMLLADGRISPGEQFDLLRLLTGGGVDETERRFMRELRSELPEVTPEFDELYRTYVQSGR